MKRWMDGWMDVSMRACLLAATSYLSCSLVALRQHSGQGALYSSMYTNQMYLISHDSGLQGNCHSCSSPSFGQMCRYQTLWLPLHNRAENAIHSLEQALHV